MAVAQGMGTQLSRNGIIYALKSLTYLYMVLKFFDKDSDAINVVLYTENIRALHTNIMWKIIYIIITYVART